MSIKATMSKLKCGHALVTSTNELNK